MNLRDPLRCKTCSRKDSAAHGLVGNELLGDSAHTILFENILPVPDIHPLKNQKVKLIIRGCKPLFKKKYLSQALSILSFFHYGRQTTANLPLLLVKTTQRKRL